MKGRKEAPLKLAAVVTAVAIAFTVIKFFHIPILKTAEKAVILYARSYFPAEGVYSVAIPEETSSEVAAVIKDIPAVSQETQKKTEPVKENKEESTEKVSSLTDTDEDVADAMAKAKKSSDKDKKDGDISDYKYTNDGVTDSYGKIKVKNVNNTDIDIKSKLNESLDLNINKDEPAVLIYHTHTTETYQLIDRDFYAVGTLSRTDDSSLNMLRVGKAICDEIESEGYKVIHVTDIHDKPYSGAYSRSRKTVEQYLKEYPSIQITLDIHRDAIQRSDGTKIAPTAEIDGKKAAQIMIISGCQEEGNGITNLPDWEHNLTFALKLQQSLEENFSGITRPLYFCPRSYNMNLTHCSLLVEVGSDANTLEEAVYTGKCLGRSVSLILEEYEER